MARTFDVLVLGDYFIDLVFTGMPKVPELGTEYYATGFNMLPGGAYNSVVGMHRLGVKVGWASDFGNDDFSRFVLQRAAAEGLDDSLFGRHDRPLRRITVVASFPHDRAFFTYMDPEPKLTAAMKALAFGSARVVYLAGLYYGDGFDAGQKLARAKGMKIVMDGNSTGESLQGNPALERAIRGMDVFMPNASEALQITGEGDLMHALDRLAALCPLVVIKDGGSGAHLAAGDTRLSAPAIPVTPIETTGAGDAFNAGFLRAWLQERPLDECLRWGNIVGGLSTQGIGGTGQVITEKEVRQWL